MRVILSIKLLTIIIKAVELGVLDKKILRLRNRRNRYILIYKINKCYLNRTFTNTSETSFNLIPE